MGIIDRIKGFRRSSPADAATDLDRQPDVASAGAGPQEGDGMQRINPVVRYSSL